MNLLLTILMIVFTLLGLFILILGSIVCIIHNNKIEDKIAKLIIILGFMMVFDIVCIISIYLIWSGQWKQIFIF